MGLRFAGGFSRIATLEAVDEKCQVGPWDVALPGIYVRWGMACNASRIARRETTMRKSLGHKDRIRFRTPLILCFSLMMFSCAHPHRMQVERPVERADQHFRVAQLELVGDVAADTLGGGGGVGMDARLRKPLLQSRELAGWPTSLEVGDTNGASVSGPHGRNHGAPTPTAARCLASLGMTWTIGATGDGFSRAGLR
jgi:hypothetical protein